MPKRAFQSNHRQFMSLSSIFIDSVCRVDSYFVVFYGVLDYLVEKSHVTSIKLMLMTRLLRRLLSK